MPRLTPDVVPNVVNLHSVGAGFLNSATILKEAYNIDDLAKGIPWVLENGSRHQKKLS